MSIVRGPRLERDFTVLSNAVLRDRRLSYKARGMLASMLSRAPGYQVSALGLAEDSPDGRTAVASGLKELEAAGYLRRSKRRRPDGTFEAVSVVYESPEDVDEPSAENLRPVPPAQTRETAGQTGRRKPARGEPADKYLELETEELKTEGPGANPIDPFDEFYLAYPLHKGPRKARSAFTAALRRADAQMIIDGARRYRDDPNRQTRYTKHPATWLNGDCWEDDPEPPTTGYPPTFDWSNP